MTLACSAAIAVILAAPPSSESPTEPQTAEHDKKVLLGTGFGKLGLWVATTVGAASIGVSSGATNVTEDVAQTGFRNPSRPRQFVASQFLFGSSIGLLAGSLLDITFLEYNDPYKYSYRRFHRRAAIGWGGVALASGVLSGTLLSISLAQSNLSRGLPYNAKTSGPQQDQFTTGTIFSGLAVSAVLMSATHGVILASSKRRRDAVQVSPFYVRF